MTLPEGYTLHEHPYTGGRVLELVNGHRKLDIQVSDGDMSPEFYRRAIGFLVLNMEMQG